MNSRWILILAVCMMGTAVFAQTGKKKPVAKLAKGSSKKKTITESEAKALHEARLAKEGKQDERRAYKRSDFTVEERTATANEEPFAAQQTAAAPTPKAVMPPRPTPPTHAANIEKTGPKPLRFIENIVLERKEG